MTGGLPDRVRWRGTEYDVPSLEQIEEWCADSVCEALDGCEVDPDGRCPHGAPAWLLALGLL